MGLVVVAGIERMARWWCWGNERMRWIGGTSWQELGRMRIEIDRIADVEVVERSHFALEHVELLERLEPLACRKIGNRRG